MTPAGFVPRRYPDIVRDLLTTLTGGTVGETAVVPAGDTIELRLLKDRPIRRVSHLEGVVAVTRSTADGEEVVEVPYRFTDADYELVASGAAGGEPDAIRFRPTGRRPPVGSTVTVNYYPSRARPAPVTDVNVGSVVRTLLEAVAREVAVVEAQLGHVYDSAFLDTAEGSSLDRVVALVGVTRRPAGVATVQVRFTRAAGGTGRIAIPVGTVVADAANNRYATALPLVLEPGEPSREVLAAAVSARTAAVDAGAIDRMEVLVAGVGSVGNDAAAVPAAAPESDADLRARARGALAVAARGTVDALHYGVLSVPGVKAVSVTEFPNGVPGEIAVSVAYEDPGDPLVAEAVADRIEELRPAGVRVVPTAVSELEVRITASLTLAGAGVPPQDLPAVQAGVEQRVVDLIAPLPPGAVLRQGPLVLAALADARIVDAAFHLETDTGAGPGVTATAAAILVPKRPFTFEVATETGQAAPGTGIALDVHLPIRLVAGVSAAEATAALTTAASSWAAGLQAGQAITVDGLLAAVRDDTRYQLLRAEAAVVAETAGRFLQLSDGVGSHPVATDDRVTLRGTVVDVREGSA
ncbi:MAG: baseplate J/gp47 family protein [Candidatus Nanopelagicales bacterium]|nr:baseplate J/gp47 family protein [Candidatus Nanopelagicales bacterium]